MPNSDILWNGASITTNQLVTVLQATLAIKPEPELQFQPAPTAVYDTVNATLNVVKRSGITKFGSGILQFLGNNAGFTGDIVRICGGVHVGSDGWVSEWVFSDAVGSSDPLTEGGVLGSHDAGEADLSGLESAECSFNDFHEAIAEKWDVVRIGVSAEADGHGGCGEGRRWSLPSVII